VSHDGTLDREEGFQAAVERELGIGKSTAYRYIACVKAIGICQQIEQAPEGEVIELEAGSYEVTKEVREKARELRENISTGAVPMTRAMSAVAGMFGVAGGGTGGKAATNHPQNMWAGVIKLRGSLQPKHWRQGKLPNGKSWDDLVNQWDQLVRQLPDELRACTSRPASRTPSSWRSANSPTSCAPARSPPSSSADPAAMKLAFVKPAASAASAMPPSPRLPRLQASPLSNPRHGAPGDPATVNGIAAPVQLNRGLGRPPLVEVLGLTGPVGEELRLFARRMVLAHNRTQEAGSYSLALQLAAQHPVAPEAFRRWVHGRKDRHSIPPSIRKWIDVPAAVQRHHRNPTEAGLRGVYCPDALRVNHRTGQRLRAGERFSADDGSVNFVLMVPWPWGGCPCSDRYGVKVGRFQLLVLHDDGSGYVPHFTWIARASQSYRAEDIASFLHTPFARLGCWQTALLERGSWESHRVRELLAAAGIERETAYEPKQKLVENWWNRAWTRLSNLPGQIGRFRGEEEEAAAMVERFRRGSEDPRGTLLMLADAATAVARVVAELNQTRLEAGPLFGSWIPAERWAADLAARPLAPLPAGIEPMTRPERRELMVRRWMVHCEAVSPLGEKTRYEFFDEALIAHEGRRVLAYFDPHDDPCTAAIYTADGRTLLAERASCLSRTPALVRDGDTYRVDWDDGQLARAQAAKAQARAAVRREHRTIAPDGKIEAWSTEVRDAVSRNVTGMDRSPEPAGRFRSAEEPDDPAEATPPARERSAATPRIINRSSRVLTDEEEAAELARIEARERAYAERNAIIL
jgi:hypothetical protein